MVETGHYSILLGGLGGFDGLFGDFVKNLGILG
jgi:hypothetical protein